MSAPAGSPDGLEDRLERLRAAGASTFDPPGYGFVASLLERGAALGGGAETRLRGRAEARLEALEASFDGARRDAAQRIEALAGAGAVGEELRQAFEAGDYAGVRWLVRRIEHEQVDDSRRRASGLAWLGRIASRARGHGARLPEDLRQLVEHVASRPAMVGAPESAPGTILVEKDAPSPRTARMLANALSRAMFRETAEAARATLAMARTTDNLPDDAGPYNGQVLAARALHEMARIAPGYLQAYIAGLDDLAALEAAPEPTVVRSAKRRRGAASARERSRS